MSNRNNPGPCANPNCQFGGVAPSIHTCPDCKLNIHFHCGHECADVHYILCPACLDKRPPRDVWCESCKARGTDEKEPYVLCNACKEKKTKRKHATTRRRQEQEEEENQEEQEESARPKKQKRHKKKQLPPSSDEQKDTSMERKLSEPDSIMDYYQDDRRDENRSLRREIHELKATIVSIKNQQDQMKIDLNQNFKQLLRHLNRIESQPGRPTRVADDDGAPANQDHPPEHHDGAPADQDHPPEHHDGAPADQNHPPEHHARLAMCPKTLHLLWDEWTDGINGNKAARTFTAQERGRVKHVFSKRKIFWNKVSELVRSGDMASSAIDKIYDVYGGGVSVTSILKAMQRDKQNGAHPLLRV
eukprot:scaffold4733_cov38-Attheya_sp.AAC.2